MRRMRSLIAAFLCACLSATMAIAQPAEPPPPATSTPEEIAEPKVPEKVTYLLIDASGSMRNMKAEETVSQVLKENDPSAWISRTYFRAPNRDACQKPVEIAEPVPREKSVAESHEFHTDDFTPLGDALKAAIVHAVKGGVSADIYLISDQEQTPGCGVDVCAVAAALLPMEDIVVHARPVIGAGAVASDRLGCIAAAQSSPERIRAVEQGAPANNSGEGLQTGSGGNTSAPLSWLASLPFAITLFLASFVVLRLLMMSQENEAIASGDDKPKQTIESVFSWVALGLAVASAVVLLSFGSAFANEWPTLFEGLNGPLLSLLVAHALLGTIGWFLLQSYAINQFRQKTASRKWKANQDEKEFQQSEKPLWEKRRISIVRKAAFHEERFPIRYRGTLQRDEIKTAAKVMERAREIVETKVAIFVGSAKYEKRKVVRELSSMSRTDYLPIIDLLHEEKAIPSKLAQRLTTLFSQWSLVKAGESDDLAGAVRDIAAVDLSSLEKE